MARDPTQYFYYVYGAYEKPTHVRWEALCITQYMVKLDSVYYAICD